MPVNVPDTSAPPASTDVATVNNWGSAGQSIAPERDGLSAVSVILATERRTDDADITFNIKVTPSGPPLRTVRRSLSELPEGDARELFAGGLHERWETFEFEPIPDSAGRKLYFSIEGKDVPKENSVGVLIYYHNAYPQGKAYLNEKSVDANLDFRTYSRGNGLDYLSTLARNLTLKRPGPLTSAVTFLALGMLYAGLIGGLLWRVARAT